MVNVFFMALITFEFDYIHTPRLFSSQFYLSVHSLDLIKVMKPFVRVVAWDFLKMKIE